MNTSTEQWKSDGDCTKCRKQNYCGKVCKPHENSVQRSETKKIANTTFGLLMKVLKNEI